MCGIVGFINADAATKFGDTARAVFEQLLWHDTQRGPHGTGVVAVNGIGEHATPTMYKSALWAPDYLESTMYKVLLQKRLDYARVAIGHNRASTKASVSNNNAHPFTHKHITLVHNGVIPGYGSFLPKDYQHDVDSFAAAYNIAELGEKEGLERVPFKGVLVWWNDQDKTLNMARNEHRLLYCVPILNQNALFYASEWRMLDWILDRNGVAPETKYKLLAPNNHFKFNPAKPKEWLAVPFVQPSNQSQTSTSRGTSSTSNGTGGNGQSTQATGTSAAATQGGSKEDDNLPLTVRPDQITDAEVDRIEKQFGRLPAKQKRKMGLPENRHRIRKVCAKIKNSGLDSYFGQRFIVYPDAFIPYKNQKKFGLITGVKRDTQVRVEIPSVVPEDFDSLKNDKWRWATVVNAKKGKAGWVLVCALIPLDMYRDQDGPVYEADDDEEPTKEEHMLPGPTGGLIPLSKFQELTAGGCGNCNEFVNPNYAKEMMWFAGSPICHICSADPQVCQMLGFSDPKKVMAH
jgi:predicted glutamine amidotransferase